MSQPNDVLHRTDAPASERPRLGLPFIALVGLALLAAVRVVFHDLGLIHEETGLNALFVALPPLVWITVAVVARVPNPLLTLLVVGLLYGVLLAVGHQVLWDISFADNPPQLGGALAGLDPSAQTVIMRVFAAVSSLATGVVVGLVSGLAAWGLSVLVHRPRA